MRLTLLVSATVFCAHLCAQTPDESPPPQPRLDSAISKPGTFPDFPPLPSSQASLIGGSVGSVDPVRDRIVIRAFGGREFRVDFDVRTRVARNGVPAAIRDLRPGTRVYADIILNNDRMFAKTIRIDANSTLGETQGQVIEYDQTKGLLRIKDVISSQAFVLRLSRQTQVLSGDKPISPTDLVQGTLIAATFHAAGYGPSAAEKITILARPGGVFTFEGTIAVIDLRDAHMTLLETPGDNTFEVGLNSLPASDRLRLKQGSNVIVRAKFDGQRYQAQSIEAVPSAHP